MAYIYIDMLLLGVIALVLPALTFAGGWLGYRARVGFVARMIGSAIRKAHPLLFLEGHDKQMRIIDMDPGLTGYWHHKYIEQIPDEISTYSLYGTPMGIATAQSVGNVNAEFADFIVAWRKAAKSGQLKSVASGGNGMEDILGREIGATDIELAKAINELERQYHSVNERIKLHDEVFAGQTTVEELVQRLKLDRDAATKFRVEFTAEQKDMTVLSEDELKLPEKDQPKVKPAAGLRKQLMRIERARKITADDEGFSVQVEGKNVRLVRHRFLSIDNYWAWIPTGSNISRVWTMIKRSAMQDKLESGFNEGQGFKWLIIGIVVMMVTIGTGVMVYLITK